MSVVYILITNYIGVRFLGAGHVGVFCVHDI